MAGPDIRRQPLYLTYRREPLTPEEAVVEEGELLTGGLGLPKADEIANKPDGEIEIDGGENVMLGATGRPLAPAPHLPFHHPHLVPDAIPPKGFSPPPH